jgi:multidrug resistance efflux pump
VDAPIGCWIGIFLAGRLWQQTALSGETALSFSQSGILASIAPLNTPLSAGALVAQLQDTDALGAKVTAETALAVEQGKMAELKAVATEEDMFVARQHQAALAEASSTLARAERALVMASLLSASSTNTALTQTSSLFSTSTDGSLQILLPTDPLTEAALVSGWQSAQGSAIQAGNDALSISANPLAAIAANTVTDENTNIAEVQLFLEDLGVATKNATSTTSIGSVDTALNTLLDAEESLAQARNSFMALADGATATSSESDIFGRNLAGEEIQEQIAIAKAADVLANASTTLAQMYIYAPAAGEITVQNVRIGQPVVAGQRVVSFHPFAQ